MAYPNNYFNSYYQPQYPVQQTVQPTQQNNGITWVQGENSAKSYPVAPGQSILLMDSEDSVFYIKSTDQSGMPSPLRIFDYTERKNNAAISNNIATKNEVDYISRSEFDAFKSEIQSVLKQSKQSSGASIKRITKEE